MNDALLIVAQQGARRAAAASSSPVTLMQVILLAVFGAGLVWMVVMTARGKVRTLTGAFWTIIALAACIATAFPELTTWVAKRILGVQAGINAVVYLTAVFMVIGFFMLYVRLQRLRNEVTLLVRRLAIAEAKEESGGEGPGGG